MANTFRNAANTTEGAPKGGGKSIFSLIEKTFHMQGVFSDGVPIQFLPVIVWTSLLILVYIANAHFAEKTIRKIDALKYEVEELRNDFTTQKASYMYESKQSEVAKRVAKLGLVESNNPPLVIEIE